MAEQLVTKEMLIENGFKITNRHILIDSTLYTSEAFEYIQQLSDAAGSILFLTNNRKIWSQGSYWGGDVWTTDMKSFANFIVEGADDIVSTLTANIAKDSLNIKGDNGILVSGEITDPGNGELQQTLKIGYDISTAVNTETFNIDTKSEYHLAVVDGKIQMIKYTAPTVTLASLPVLEHNSGDKQISISYKITGTDELISFVPTITNGEIIEVTSTAVIVKVYNNTDATISLEYSDGKNGGKVSTVQKWGYIVVYGIDRPSISNFDTFGNHYLVSNSISNTITTQQGTDEYYYFACPDTFEPKFTDTSIGLQGGWEFIDRTYHYSDSVPYKIYRTENSGLGTVKWRIE